MGVLSSALGAPDMRMLLVGQLHFFSFDHRTPLVVAAVRTDMVRKLGLITLGAGGQVGKCKPLMGPSLATS